MIREVKFSDLESIARLHIESFENHFLPKLGTNLLANYYKEFIRKENIFIVSIDETEEVNGLVLGTPDSSVGKSQFVRNNKFKLAIRIAFLCLILDKETWSRVIKFLKSTINTKKSFNEEPKALNNSLTLLSICVSDKAKGTGLAIDLIKEFELRLKQLGYNFYTLSVRRDNERANSFYRKMGLSVYKESDGQYKYFKKI